MDEALPTPETDKFDSEGWKKGSAGWRERTIDLEDALEFARGQERAAALHTAGYNEEVELRIAVGKENSELRKAIYKLIGVIEAHECTCFSCDRDGERYCDCLKREVEQAKNSLKGSRALQH